MMARQQQKKNQSTEAPNARERAIDAYDVARDRTRDGIDGATILALGGGLALGALIAALLPKTQTEADGPAWRPDHRRRARCGKRCE